MVAIYYSKIWIIVSLNFIAFSFCGPSSILLNSELFMGCKDLHYRYILNLKAMKIVTMVFSLVILCTDTFNLLSNQKFIVYIYQIAWISIIYWYLLIITIFLSKVYYQGYMTRLFTFFSNRERFQLHSVVLRKLSSVMRSCPI